jgi:hypothetical protein
MARLVGVWQGVAMDSLKFHPGLPCPTPPCPAGGPPLKRPGVATCGHLLSLWTPHAERLRRDFEIQFGFQIIFRGERIAGDFKVKQLFEMEILQYHLWWKYEIIVFMREK